MSSLPIWVGTTIALLALLAYRWASKSLDSVRERRPELPSHYNVERYVTRPESVPGRCHNCGTANEEGYRYCAECAERLEGTERERFDLQDLHR